MKTIDTQWFRGLLSDRRISQNELARRMRMDPSSMSLMLRGKRQMRMDEAEILSRELNVRLDEVIFHAGAHTIWPDKVKNNRVKDL